MQATRSVWLNLQHLSEPAAQLERATTSLSPLVTQIIHNRGIGAEELSTFLRPDLLPTPDPFGMLGMAAAVERLLAARAAGEVVAVYGDFDVDGVTGTAVLVEAFGAAGIRAIPYIPHRQQEGTGLNQVAIDGLAAQGVRLVVTVDCGITSARAIGTTMAAGIDVIVTDHHSPPDVLPPAVAIVDPRQPGCRYPFKDLAGVGVAFRLAQALFRRLGTVPRSVERTLLDLVAIGTIADMVPLRDENRALVWRGIRLLNSTDRLGLQALIARSGLRMGAITSTDVGYRICPRLNAAGRLDHASIGYGLLTTTSYEDADAFAQRLEEKNTERQQLTHQVMGAAHEHLARLPHSESDRLIVMPIEPWASGVMGLLAGKLVEETGKPVVVVQESGDGDVRGSARGTPAFDVLEALRENADLLDQFGGHQLAAGFTTSAERAVQLADRLRARASQSLAAEDVLPTLQIDAEVAPRELTWALHDQLQALEPCGMGNPLPLFIARQLRVFDYRQVGNNHLRLLVGRGSTRLTAIVFRRGELAHYLRRNMHVDLVFNLEANEWNGYRTLQLRVRDMQFEPAFQFDADSLCRS